MTTPITLDDLGDLSPEIAVQLATYMLPTDAPPVISTPTPTPPVCTTEQIHQSMEAWGQQFEALLKVAAVRK